MSVSLDDKYGSEEGPVLLTGIQALVRSTLDQRRLDDRRRRDTRVFVSGYQGSPLGGVDRELHRARHHADALGVVFRPGLNEELAATAVAGTQLLGQLDRRRHEGVTGIWFGKAPGLDRAADAIRHATLSGTAPLGGAVAWIGDDPTAKSSTVPSASESLCRSLVMPLLAPGTVEEIVQLGLHAVALSRHAGLWTGLKIVADIADATATVELGGMLDAVPAFVPREAHHAPTLLPPFNLDAELDLTTVRLDRAREYARAAGLNRVVHEPARPRLAIVAGGLSHQAVLRALDELGLVDDALDALGVRLVRLSMPWPLDRDVLREVLARVETVPVVEDKLPFVETLVRDALYRLPGAPLVLGKEDADGRPLLSPRSALTADDVARALGRVLGEDALAEGARARLRRLAEQAAPDPDPLPRRTPYFCSGCPHNISTAAPHDTLVGVGIGCHTMVALDADDRRGTLLGMPQMGGEGAQWLGLQPFTDDVHMVQNMGDGTFHHSGSLAIRAAVAGGARITYKLLYNDAVAMTGGQRPEGQLSIPALTRWLRLEGVARVVVTTPEPEGYRRVALAEGTAVRHRDELQAVAAELAAVDGVTVLIHDDRCATEERRLRKRGKLRAPAQRITINQRVCEGCGDCGDQSTCLSVQPVDTEFGRKTQIHQASCNQDTSCLKGDCPSFLTVVPGTAAAPTRPGLARIPGGSGPARPGGSGPAPSAGGTGAGGISLPEPVRRVPEDVLVRIPGVGGTGVVTISQILQMAAHLEGRPAAGLEQIGLAQKGGPVISDLRIGAVGGPPVRGQLRATAGTADVLLGFDLLGAAAAETLATADPSRTVAVVNTTRTPTATMVTDPRAGFGSSRRPLARIDAVTRAGEGLRIDAGGLAEALFADHMPANMLLVGAAFQHGCLPLGAEAIERAIALNGAAVDENLAAFRWGRAAAADPEAVRTAATPPSTALAPPAPPDGRVAALVRDAGLSGALAELVVHRGTELVAFQDLRAARAYVRDVAGVAAAEVAATGTSGGPVAKAYARGLHKLLAYKDEYEIARLHLDATERSRVAREFGPDARVRVMLQPPLLRTLGIDRKLAMGPWIRPAFATLHRMRRLRGTRLDPFGRTEVRRIERALPGQYRQVVAEALRYLRPDTVGRVVALAELPDVVRGYEDVKLRNVAEYRARTARELTALATADPSDGRDGIVVRRHAVGSA
jgi:indolepyruvate ferredoxin oxidoreductase